jgi:cysteinyl-tRNA synthetase
MASDATGMTADRTVAMRPLDRIETAVVQLQNYADGRLDELAAAGFDLAIVDLARDAGSNYFTADEIARLRDAGTRVLAYFEIGSIEDFRPDFAAVRAGHADLLLNEWPEWPGEFFVRYWDPRWWELAIRPRLDRALEAGFDGVFMDTPLAYEELDLALVPGWSRERLATEMVELIRRISRHAKADRPEFWVFPNNSPELQAEPGYLDAIDGIGMESMFFLPGDRPCDLDYCEPNLQSARALRDAGKVVLAIDYAERPDNVAAVRRRYQQEGFVGFVTVRALDTLGQACSPSTLTTSGGAM